ncbi:hypothetical protein HZS_4721, partial [Henneguya salminicola]
MVRHNRPDIIIYFWKGKKSPNQKFLEKTKIIIIDLAVTTPNGTADIEGKKIQTYTRLAKALEILHHTSVEIIPIVMSNLGGYTQALTHLKKIIPVELAELTLKAMNTLITREATNIHNHFISL